MTVAAIGNTANASGAGPPQGYVVKPGDTLSGIAAAHGVSLQALETANPQILHPNLIRPGQHLTLPSPHEDAPATPRTYTVEAGDTLTGVASRLGVDWRTLAQVNHLSDPNLIRVGQELLTGGAAATGRAASAGAPAQAASGGSGGGAHAAAIARSYLGRNASDLKADTRDHLPMDAGVSSKECCANFVSAVLVQAGELPAGLHTDSVAQLKSTLLARGWTPVSAADAKAGDVVIMQKGISHTEMVSGPGQMIGSNNTNADGTQKVGYCPLNYAQAHGGLILRAPGGAATTSPSATAGGPTAADAASATPATLPGRISAAVTYFEGQGWTHAQAAGIVGNLLGENGSLSPHLHERLAGGAEGPGRGLAQWTSPSRLAAFRAHFNGRGPDQTSFREQLSYLQHELSTTERHAASDIRAATTPGQAAAAAVEAERPADAVTAARVRGGYAEQVFRDTQ